MNESDRNRPINEAEAWEMVASTAAYTKGQGAHVMNAICVALLDLRKSLEPTGLTSLRAINDD